MGTVFVLVFFVGAMSTNSSASMWSESFSSEQACLEAGEKIQAMIQSNQSSVSGFSRRPTTFVCVRK